MSAVAFPGFVCTVFNWARPRDLSHYETFEHYHATFYKHVEPLSVTPFSPGALQRGLAGLLVSLVRLRGIEFNPNEAASRITTSNPYVQDAIETIAKRAELIGDGLKTGRFLPGRTVEQGRHLAGRGPEHNGWPNPDLYREAYGSDGPKKGTTVKSPAQSRHWNAGKSSPA